MRIIRRNASYFLPPFKGGSQGGRTLYPIGSTLGGRMGSPMARAPPHPLLKKGWGVTRLLLDTLYPIPYTAFWKHKIWDLHCGNTRSVFWEHKIWDLYCGNIGSALWDHKIWGMYSGNARSVVWEHKIWDLHSGHTRSAFWKHKVCDLHSGNTGSVFCVHKTKTWWTIPVRSG